MDPIQELFDSGQYMSLHDRLQRDSVTTSLADQLILNNNIIVCRYLMENCVQKRNGYVGEFVDILAKCYSVPVRDDILCVELDVLYNYLYIYNAVKVDSNGSTQGMDVYSRVYKTFSRVCRKVGIEKRMVVLQYSDVKAVCFGLLNKCLDIMQYGTANQSLSTAFCQCTLLLCIQNITNGEVKTTNMLLQKVKTVLDNLEVILKKPVTLALPLCVDHVQLSAVNRELLADVASFLMGVCLCRIQSWEEAVTILEKIDKGAICTVARFLLGFALYKHEKYADGISQLMELLRSPDTITQRLKARVYNLIGKCFDKLDKCQLSVQMFKKALCIDFSYLVPLYNASLQYRNQGLQDMELECLNLLATALEMRGATRTCHEDFDLVCLLDTDDGDMPYAQALYSLALRSLQLKRFDVAAEKYIQLLGYLKSWNADIKCTACIPPLLRVHHEAIESLLKSKKYDECVSLCDRVLPCYHSNMSSYNESSLRSQTFDQSMKGKRKFVEMSESQLDDEHFGDVDVLALMYKAEALVKMGDNSASLVCLQQAIDTITAFRRFKLYQQMKDVNCAEPIKKRLKTDPMTRTSTESDRGNAIASTSNQSNSGNENTASISNDSDFREDPRMCTSNDGSTVLDVSYSSQNKPNAISFVLQDSVKRLELERKLYEMTAEILESMHKNKDAVHYNRLAAQIHHLRQAQ